ncbi:hypothetical protein AB0P21_08970 [Kribbella sp. NPDC056861]|uniref:immunity protein Imm33 domain-containing protein n=1 Tax=Kribbella sp. NPDC056861 TaxID=3154857 RepID=UPI00342D18FC
MADTSSPKLDELIARGRRREVSMPEVLWGVIGADLVVPMSGEGIAAMPVVTEVDGVPHMSVFTTLERAAMVGSRADRSITLSGRRVIEGLQPGVGLTVVAAEDGGLHIDPETIARLKGSLRRDGQRDATATADGELDAGARPRGDQAGGPAPAGAGAGAGRAEKAEPAHAHAPASPAPAPVIHPAPAGNLVASTPIGNATVEASASAEEFARLTSVVHQIEQLAPASLREGYSLWFGWVPIIVHQTGPAAFDLITPDLLALDGSWTRDLSLPLRVLAEQSTLLAEIGLPTGASTPSFRDRVIIEAGAESAESVYLHRIPVERDDDSGWYLGISEQDHVRGELRACRVADLLRLRRTAMQLLALPDGTMAFLHGDKLLSVIDANDQQLWPPANAVPESVEEA